jgi:hypothetical protein
LARNPTIASTFLLANFVPFRLNRLADAVSQDLSEIYRDRFGLDIPENAGQQGGRVAHQTQARGTRPMH